MKNEKKIVYEININNAHFSCILLEEKEEKNIPNILKLPNLELITKEKKNDDNIKMYYKLNDILKIKIIFDERKKSIEKNFPLSISLERLRHLLITNFEDDFCFTYNGNLIQRNEEDTFTLNSIIKNNSINLKTPYFNFNKEEDENIDFRNNNKENNQALINNLNENKNNIEKNNEIDKNKNIGIKDKINTKNEKEYEIINIDNDNLICKIKVSSEMKLTELRENFINLIPKRSKFLKDDEIIKISEEDSILVEKISNQNKIFIQPPKEDKNELFDIEIFINGKSYIKREFYITLKLKIFRTNLKFDNLYKIYYKKKLLPIEEENKMTLDELCYKELKVFFYKGKNDSDINIEKFNNFKLEKKIYNFSFKKDDDYETWIILGFEKNGKTTFINCLLNYCKEINFEDKFRYLFEEKNKNDIGVYDINGESNKIRVIEFPGFSSSNNELIREKIENYLKTVEKIKIICFVINGNTTRLIEEIKNIFSTVLSIFGNDVKNNFVFLFTYCDNANPPFLKVIRDDKESIFSNIIPKLQKPYFFKFNNSYLFENRKDFWDIGITFYGCLLKEIKKRKNNSLQITKKLIDLKNLYKNNKIKFINSLYNFQQITEYLYFLLNIDTFKNNDKLIVYEINECYYCMSCNKIANNYCQNCNNHKIQKVRNIKNVDLNTLFKNEFLKKICLEQNLYIFKNQLENIIKILYQELDANYCKYNGLQLNENKNNALFKDLLI